MNSQPRPAVPPFSRGEKDKDEGQTSNALATTQSDPWPERRRKIREREWRIYEKILDKCEKAIDSLLSERGHRLSALDITRLLDLGERIGRLAAGLPKDNIAQDIDGEDDRTLRLEVSAAIKKIYSMPMETLAAKNPRHLCHPWSLRNRTKQNDSNKTQKQTHAIPTTYNNQNPPRSILLTPRLLSRLQPVTWPIHQPLALSMRTDHRQFPHPLQLTVLPQNRTKQNDLQKTPPLNPAIPTTYNNPNPSRSIL